MNRDELFAMLFQAYLSNNELRSDLNAGIAMRKDGFRPAIAIMFDVVDAVLTEDTRRKES